MQNRVGIYLRKAQDCSHDIVQSLLDRLEKVACDSGDIVVDRYIDNGVSGRKFCRPALDRMLNDCKCGKFDKILIWRVSHLARDSSIIIRIGKILKDCGIMLGVAEDGTNNYLEDDFFDMLLFLEKESRHEAQRKYAGTGQT